MSPAPSPDSRVETPTFHEDWYSDQQRTLLVRLCRYARLYSWRAEYAELIRKLIAKLARKRPSPLVRGDLRIWAAAAPVDAGKR